MPIRSKITNVTKIAGPEYPRLAIHLHTGAVALLIDSDKAIIIHPGSTVWRVGSSLSPTDSWGPFNGTVSLTSE